MLIIILIRYQDKRTEFHSFLFYSSVKPKLNYNQGKSDQLIC